MTEENKTKRTPLPCVNNYAVLLRALKDWDSCLICKGKDFKHHRVWKYWLDWAKDKAKEAIAQAEGKP